MPDNQEVQQEEKFEIGLTDEQILAQVKLWEQESEDFFGLLKRVWEQNLEYYKGNQTGVNQIYGRQSKAVENRIWMATETTIPIVTTRLPDIEVISGSEDELYQIQAQQLQDILGYHMERLGTQEKSEKFVRDILTKRFGVFKIPWDKTSDDVDLQVIDPKRMRFPKYGTSVRDLKFTIEELELDYDTVEEMFPKKADEVKKLSPIESENKVRKPTYLVKEIWTNDFLVYLCGNIVLKKEKNPLWNWDGENFLSSPSKPYVIKSLFHTAESIVGETDYIQQMIPIQDNINKRKRQLENIIGKVSNPILCVDSEVMSEEEAANITNEEGFILYGNGAADGTKVRFENPGQVPQQVFEDLNSSRSEFDNIWGVHSTTRGERQGKETLGGRQLLKQADLGRIDLVARQLERALDEVAEWWVQLILMFYTEDRSFSILGPEGVSFIQGFSKEKVGKNIRLQVKSGSTLPKDEVTIHQEAKELWQLQAIGVKTLYKMLKLPNIADAMQDFIDLKSGKLFQPAQPAGVVAGGTPPGAPPVAPAVPGLQMNAMQ